MPIRWDVDPGGEWLIPFAKKKLAQLKAQFADLGIDNLQRWYQVDDGTRIGVASMAGFDRITVRAGGAQFGWGYNYDGVGLEVSTISRGMDLLTKVADRGVSGATPFDWVGLEHLPIGASGSIWTLPSAQYLNNSEIWTYSGFIRSDASAVVTPRIWGAFLGSYKRGGEFEYQMPASIDGVTTQVVFGSDSTTAVLSEDATRMVSRIRNSVYGFYLHKHTFVKEVDPETEVVSLNVTHTLLANEPGGTDSGGVTGGAWLHNSGLGGMSASPDVSSIAWGEEKREGGSPERTHHLRVVQVDVPSGIRQEIDLPGYVGAYLDTSDSAVGSVTDQFQFAQVTATRVAAAPWAVVRGYRVANSATNIWAWVKVYRGSELRLEAGGVDAGVTTASNYRVSYSGDYFAVSTHLAGAATAVVMGASEVASFAGLTPIQFSRDETALLCSDSGGTYAVIERGESGGWARHGVVDADGEPAITAFPNGYFLDAPADGFTWAQNNATDAAVHKIRRRETEGVVTWVFTEGVTKVVDVAGGDGFAKPFSTAEYFPL